MKHRLAGTLALCLALAMLLTAVPALAAGDATRYLIPDTDISLEIPGGWQMLTLEDDLTQDPIYGNLGDAEDIRDAWRDSNNVMHAWKGDASHVTLIVDAQASDPRPLSEYSQAELDALAQNFVTDTTTGNAVDLLDWDNGTFLRITQTLGGANGRVLYLGVVNGTMFALMLLDRNATVPQDVAAEVEGMARSMRFDGEAALAVPTQTYSVADLAITFQLPEDWTVSNGIQAPFAADSPDSQSRFLVLRSQGFGPALMSMNAAEALPDLAQLQKLALGMARKAGGGGMPYAIRQAILIAVLALLVLVAGVVLLVVLLRRRKGGKPPIPPAMPLGSDPTGPALPTPPEPLPAADPAQPSWPGGPSDPATAQPPMDPAPVPPVDSAPIPPVEPIPTPPVDPTPVPPVEPIPAPPAWSESPAPHVPAKPPVPAPSDLPRLRACPHCNATIPEESRFCPHCGQATRPDGM